MKTIGKGIERGAAFFIDTHIVLSTSKSDLESKVRARGQNGWEPLGDMHSMQANGETVLAQLVVRVASNMRINPP